MVLYDLEVYGKWPSCHAGCTMPKGVHTIVTGQNAIAFHGKQQDVGVCHCQTLYPWQCELGSQCWLYHMACTLVI